MSGSCGPDDIYSIIRAGAELHEYKSVYKLSKKHQVTDRMVVFTVCARWVLQ